MKAKIITLAILFSATYIFTVLSIEFSYVIDAMPDESSFDKVNIGVAACFLVALVAVAWLSGMALTFYILILIKKMFIKVKELCQLDDTDIV